MVLWVKFDEELIKNGFKVQKEFLDAVFFDRTVGLCQGLNMVPGGVIVKLFSQRDPLAL